MLAVRLLPDDDILPECPMEHSEECLPFRVRSLWQAGGDADTTETVLQVLNERRSNGQRPLTPKARLSSPTLDPDNPFGALGSEHKADGAHANATLSELVH